MKKVKKIPSSLSAKKAAGIKIKKKSNSIEDSPFLKKKMQKGAQMLAIAGPPK